MTKQFRVEVVTEGLLGSLFLGPSQLPMEKMEEVMNNYGRQGWDVTFMFIEKNRVWVFWEREAAIITFARSV